MEENNSLSQLMVGRDEIDHIYDGLQEIKTQLKECTISESELIKDVIKKVDKLSEILEDDIEYMKCFADEFPKETIREIVQDCMENKRIPFMNEEGIFTAEYENFTSQPAEGMLYDLNRDFATSYTLYSPRTVNDLGCAVLITHLVNENTELKKKLKKDENHIS